ncbi:tetratricopeptide repeat protein [Opitutus sp. ER46]|uniref:tetratricopeptide repeat protein n=1 Tax=Opitutus sp. ER46 TaxID=2161864 RepID=UPI000D2FA1D9|nr:tetratricopeptide repeat protein [Opitutus sp. ER46]PTX94590.1 hypothetical protein DB354_12725 [Opitutus sp. ER46]
MTSRTSAPGTATAPWWDRSSPWLIVLIFAAALVAYSPALSAGFIWDDAGHVTRPELRTLGGLYRIWFDFGATQQYYPLLHSAFWLESHLWGDAPFGYHLLNVLLHATAACLFATVLRRLAVPGAWLAALLFTLHPVAAESVAWVAEQKNTLSLVFYLCAALAYLRFEDDRRPARYAVASLWFFAALATKTVTATLPAALLVLAWWRRGRIDVRRDVLPLLPWFALALVGGLLTAWAERTLIGAQGEGFGLGPVERVLLAGRVVWFYLLQLLWPANLVFIYPRWTVDAASAWQYLFPLAAVGLAVALLLTRRRGQLAAYLLFGGALFPALGFVNVYPFLFSYVADHFQYLASLAVHATLGVGLTLALARWRAATLGGFAVLLLALGFLTSRQSANFRDNLTLFSATLERNPDSWMVRNNLAEALAAAGRHEEAIPHLQRALQLRPDFPLAENNLGDDLRVLGRLNEAIPHLERALKLQPKFAEAHNNLAAALMVAGRAAEGLAHFQEAVRLKPGYAVAHRNLGLALATEGRTAEALPHFATAVRLDPTDAEAELNWAIALTLSDQFSAAVPHFERAAQLAPADARVPITYGRALARAGRHAEAVTRFRAALELAPTDADAWYNLALSCRQLGRAGEAAEAMANAQRYRGAR